MAYLRRSFRRRPHWDKAKDSYVETSYISGPYNSNISVLCWGVDVVPQWRGRLHKNLNEERGWRDSMKI